MRRANGSVLPTRGAHLAFERGFADARASRVRYIEVLRGDDVEDVGPECPRRQVVSEEGDQRVILGALAEILGGDPLGEDIQIGDASRYARQHLDGVLELGRAALLFQARLSRRLLALQVDRTDVSGQDLGGGGVTTP